MASVEKALEFVFKQEGGFSDHPADKGGRTKYGVTQATLDAARAKRSDAKYPKDVANLTKEQAVDIYTKDYLPDGFDDIKSQRIGTVILDMSVNSGLGRSATLTQRALCAIGSTVAVDGSFGPKSLAAVNASDPDALFGAIRNQRVAFYHHIVERDPSQSVFLKGWMNRANDVPPEA